MICDFNYGTEQKLFKDHDETKKHLFCYITAERNYLSRPVWSDSPDLAANFVTKAVQLFSEIWASLNKNYCGHFWGEIELFLI